MHHLTLTSTQRLTHTCCHIVMKITTPHFKASHTLVKNEPILFADHSLSVLRGLSIRHKQLNKIEKENQSKEKQKQYTHRQLPSATGTAQKHSKGIVMNLHGIYYIQVQSQAWHPTVNHL